MAIKNYRTRVGESKSVGEIMALLAQNGARSVNITYDSEGRPEAVSFVIMIHQAAGDYGIPVPFRLPCNVRGVLKSIGVRSPSKSQEEHARNVAWRIIKDWVAAQMALIQAEQASLAQVFLPYVVQDEASGVTLYDRFLEQTFRQKALTDGVTQ